jgi:hypothetical protein
MLCNLKRLVNTGQKELNLVSFFFRQNAKFDITEKKIKQVPNLWRASKRGVWYSTDASLYWGGMTCSPYADNFIYYLNEKTRHQHPDAIFYISSSDQTLKKGVVLKPGDEYDARDYFWMMAVCGENGTEGWNKDVLSFFDTNAL